MKTAAAGLHPVVSIHRSATVFITSAREALPYKIPPPPINIPLFILNVAIPHGNIASSDSNIPTLPYQQ